MYTALDMVLGPTHGGWGRDVNPEAFREANVGPRVVLRIGDKIDVIFSESRTGKDRDFFKSAGVILEGAPAPCLCLCLCLCLAVFLASLLVGCLLLV